MYSDNRGHWKKQKAQPIEIPNSELPPHLKELIAERELDAAIKLMDKSVKCLFLELPEPVANHNQGIWLNLKKLISDIYLNGASQGTMPNEQNPDNQKSYSELKEENTQLKSALSKAQSKITELLIERDERK